MLEKGLKRPWKSIDSLRSEPESTFKILTSNSKELLKYAKLSNMVTRSLVAFELLVWTLVHLGTKSEMMNEGKESAKRKNEKSEKNEKRKNETEESAHCKKQRITERLLGKERMNYIMKKIILKE